MSVQADLFACDPFADTQPYYAAYCIAHGVGDPDEMLERDAMKWPGGCMAGFTVWINERWRDFRNETGRHHASADDHYVFEPWLIRFAQAAAKEGA